MTKMEGNNLRDLLEELFLIIGGFILAETILQQFLSLSSNTLEWWVLPLFSILLITTALSFRDRNISLVQSGLLSTFFFGASIVLIVFVKKNIISNISFLWWIFMLSILAMGGYLILFFYKKKNNGE